MDEKGVSPKELVKLKDFFREESIEWLPKNIGKSNNQYWAMLVPYITRVAVMDRLDDVCGPENWQDRYEQGPGGGVICYLSIRVNGEWITKCDGAENTQVEPIKGGISDSFKRAAARWGVARYLALLPVFYADVNQQGKFKARYKPKNGAVESFKYDVPRLPVEWVPAIIEDDVVIEIKNEIKNHLDKYGRKNLSWKQTDYIDYKFKVGFTESEARRVLERLKGEIIKNTQDDKPEETGKFI